MKSVWKAAWPAFAVLILVLSLFAFTVGLAIAIKPENLGCIPSNLPLYLRVLAGIGGVAIYVAAYLNYYRAIGIIDRK